MSKSKWRTPKNYDSTELTIHRVKDLLSLLLGKIQEIHQERPDLVLLAWPDIIGPQLAPMTQATSFVEGILIVKVNNSTLYSLLSQGDKPRILLKLRNRFPKVEIKNIFFRIG